MKRKQTIAKEEKTHYMSEPQKSIDGNLYKTIIAIVDSKIHEIKVQRKEFDRLNDAVYELTQSHKKAEERLTRVEIAIEELTQAQKRTEEEIRKLSEAQLRTDKTVNDIKKELGGLSHTVGYHLEGRAYKTLPELLKRDFGVEVDGKLVRRFFVYEKGKEDEVNIYGKGFKEGKEVTIIGESKSQLSENDINSFLDKVQRVTTYTKRKNIENILIAVSYSIRPEVEEYASKKVIKLYWSYELGI